MYVIQMYFISCQFDSCGNVLVLNHSACFLSCIYTSVVPMIDYNRKSFIYIQPIINRLEFWESFIIRKIFKQKNFIFIQSVGETPLFGVNFTC